MDTLMIVVIAIHASSGVFWAGSTATLANLGPNAGTSAERLFPFQMGSAGLTVLTGLALWAYWRGGALGTSELILLFGILAAFVAGAVQGSIVGPARRALAGAEGAESALHQRIAGAHRVAAGLLTITVITMVVSRFF